MDDLFNVQNLIDNPPAATTPAGAAPATAAATVATQQAATAQAAQTASTSPEPTTTEQSNQNDTAAPGENQGEGAPDQTPASPAGEPNPDDSPAAKEAAAAGAIDPAQGNETPEQLRARLSQEITLTAKEAAQNELFKSLGVETLEELQAKLNPAAALTPEQQKRQDDLHRASVQEFSVRELGMAPEDFTRLDQVRSRNDQEIVYDHFRDAWMAKNKDNALFTGKDLENEAKYEFDALFHLNSENQRMKALGEESLAATAAQIREQNENKWKTAETEYQNFTQLKNQVSQFRAGIRSVIGQNLPKELSWDIAEGGKVTFQLDKLDKKGLEKYLSRDSNFDVFLKGNKQEFGTLMENKIKEYIAINHYDDMVKTAIRTSHDAGVKKATVGAKAPFTTAPAQPANVKSDDLTDADRAKIASIATMRP